MRMTRCPFFVASTLSPGGITAVRSGSATITGPSSGLLSTRSFRFKIRVSSQPPASGKKAGRVRNDDPTSEDLAIAPGVLSPFYRCDEMPIDRFYRGLRVAELMSGGIGIVEMRLLLIADRCRRLGLSEAVRGSQNPDRRSACRRNVTRPVHPLMPCGRGPAALFPQAPGRADAACRLLSHSV